MEIKCCDKCHHPVGKSNYCDMCGNKVRKHRVEMWSHYHECQNCCFIFPNSVKYCPNCGQKNTYLDDLERKYLEEEK